MNIQNLPTFQPPNLTPFEKETLIIDKIGNAAVVLSLTASAMSGNIFLAYASYTLIAYIAYKLIINSKHHQDSSSLSKKWKLLAKEGCLIVYLIVVKFLQSILNQCSISNDTLNRHCFKMEILRKYANVEFTRMYLKRKFQPFLKISMLNLPKLEHALNNSYLSSAKEYLTSFSQKCTNKEIIPNEDDLIPPMNGICSAVVGRVFEKLQVAGATLESVTAKYQQGGNKKTSGLQSFYLALNDKRLKFPKMNSSHLMLEQIGITSSERQFSYLISTEERGSNILLAFRKFFTLNDGDYHMSIARFFPSQVQVIDGVDSVIDGSSHAIFIRKQNNDLTIIDPSIGLLKAEGEGDSYSLMNDLLLFYGRKNEHIYLEAHALKSNRTF